MITITTFENDNGLVTVNALANGREVGRISFFVENGMITIKNPILNEFESNESESHCMYGLLRFMFNEAAQLGPIHKIKSTGLPSKVNCVEQLYSIFSSTLNENTILELTDSFINKVKFPSWKKDGAYILVSHGEKIHSNKKAMMVLEGKFETSNETNFSDLKLFAKQERFAINEVFRREYVNSIANGQLLEINEEGVETMKTPIAPFGVSAYNGFLISHVFVALHELGWFSHVKQNIDQTFQIEIDKIALNCQNDILIHLYSFIQDAGIIEMNKERTAYKINKEAFISLDDEVGYVKFILQGYNSVLLETVGLAKGELKYWRDIKRNDNGVGEFLLTYHNNVEPAVFETVKDVEFKKMAYLGCGSGKRLIELCLANPGSKAIGVEIDPSVAKVARDNIRIAGLDNRIEIVEEDLMTWALKPHHDVDLILFIMGMAHDFLKDKIRAKRVFWEMKNNLAPGARMILEDINIQEKSDPWSGMTINRGFELVHALMGVNLGTRDKYIQIFKSFGWEIEFVRGTGLPNAWIYVIKSNKVENLDKVLVLSEEKISIL